MKQVNANLDVQPISSGGSRYRTLCVDILAVGLHSRNSVPSLFVHTLHASPESMLQRSPTLCGRLLNPRCHTWYVVSSSGSGSGIEDDQNIMRELRAA